MVGRKRKSKSKSDNDFNDGGDESGPFTRGSIIRVHLTNFMTYKDVELHAGPYLNLVLGPNGTGKSALVCAIIVGLGGDPSATGRSGTLVEYIRFGCACGITEIELSNPGGENYIIERKLIKNENKCRTEWKLNGNPRNQTQIRELISSLNIRVSNLCQFLPQEKVVEFARMNPQQLLENTEKAAGDENMFSDHEKLIKLSQDIGESTKKKETLDKQLATDQHLNERMAEQVERVKEREKYKEQVKWLQKKKPWIEFEAVRQEYVAAKNELVKCEKELEKNKAKNKPLEEKVSKEKKTMDKASDASRAAVEELRSTSSLVTVKKKEYDKISDKIAETLANLTGKHKLEEQRLRDLDQLQGEKNLLEERLQSLSDDDFTSQINELDEQLGNKQKRLEELSYKKEDLVTESDRNKEQIREVRSALAEIINVKKKRSELLERIDPKVYEAAVWLQRNREKFSHNIFPPIMTQINVKNREWVRHVESTIPFRDLIAFVCEDINDLRLFTTTLRKEKGLNVSVVQAPDAVSTNLNPKVPLERLRSYGFSHYIKDLFEAPDAIVRYLCKSFNLHSIPIGDENVDASKVLKENLPIQKFHSGNTSYTWNISKYDREKVTTTDRLKEPSLLTMIIDIQKKQRLDEQLSSLEEKCKSIASNVKSLQDEIEIVRSEMNSLKEEKKQLMAKRDERKILEGKISQKNSAISRKVQEKIDLEAEKTKTKDILESLVKKKMETLESVEKVIEKCLALNSKKLASQISSAHAQKKLVIATEELERANADFSSLEAEVLRLKEIRDIKRREAKLKQQNANRAIGCEGDMPRKIKTKFNSLPDTLEEIDDEIRRLALRMESMKDYSDASVLKDYDQQTNLIEMRKKEIEKMNVDLEVMKSDLEIVKNRWLPPLQALISQIGTNFSKFMAQLEYAGEVSLSHGDNPDDFEKYGISITVRYRDKEELKELSAFHQSGGERSVATMIYMIALQELTKVPFRIVDEINQGMDATNERRVFDLIVETASTNSSQYFLFSPKLLPGLTYTDRMHIHVIFNGPKFSVDWNECKPSE